MWLEFGGVALVAYLVRWRWLREHDGSDRFPLFYRPNPLPRPFLLTAMVRSWWRPLPRNEAYTVITGLAFHPDFEGGTYEDHGTHSGYPERWPLVQLLLRFLVRERRNPNLDLPRGFGFRVSGAATRAPLLAALAHITRPPQRTPSGFEIAWVPAWAPPAPEAPPVQMLHAPVSLPEGEAPRGVSWILACEVLQQLSIHETHAKTLSMDERLRLPTRAELGAEAADLEWVFDVGEGVDGAHRLLVAGNAARAVPADEGVAGAGFRAARVHRTAALTGPDGRPALAVPGLPDRFLRDHGDRPLDTSVGLRFAWVPPGRAAGRHFPHGFWMSETPLTQGQHRALLAAAGFPLEHGGIVADFSQRLGDDRPLDSVTFAQACFLAEVFTLTVHEEGRVPLSWEVRLPGEAEWEYACRAGTTGPHYGPLDEVAWHQGNSRPELRPDGPPIGHPVGLKLGNAWGLKDMLGNVAEWCLDVAGEDDPAPDSPLPRLAGPDPTRRVLRGGCFRHGPDLVAADARIERRISEPRDSGIGVRFVVTPRLAY